MCKRRFLLRLLFAATLCIHCFLAKSIFLSKAVLADECASFDSASSMLQIPSLVIGESIFSVDLNVTFTEAVRFELAGITPGAQAGPESAIFDPFHLTLRHPCLSLDGDTYNFELLLVDLTTITFEMTGFGRNDLQARVTKIINYYRDLLRDQVPEHLRQAVTEEVAQYSLETSTGDEPIRIIASHDETPRLTPSINRRDWGYAMHGISSTLTGALIEGQSGLLDLGFWCFLEAALLQPDEPEHLSNVAFFLNEKGRHEHARRILEYAQSLDQKNTLVLNNLAYACAGLGEYDSAIEKIYEALEQAHGIFFLLDRLSNYMGEAGHLERANLVKETLAGECLSRNDYPRFSRDLLTSEGNSVAWDLEKMIPLYYDGVTKDLEVWQEYHEENRQKHYDVMNILNAEVFYDCSTRVLDECRNRDDWRLCSTIKRCGECVIPPTLDAWASYVTGSLFPHYLQKALDANLKDVTANFVKAKGIIESSGIGEQEKQLLLETVWLRKIFDENISYCKAKLMAPDYHSGKRSSLDDSLDDFLLLVVEDHYRRFPPSMPFIFDVRLLYLYCISGEAEEAARAAEETRKKELARGMQYFNACPAAFCGKLLIPLGLISVEVDMRTGSLDTIEVGIGQGIVGKFGWNLRKSEPIVGFGYGANLDELIKLGAVIKYSPSTGLKGKVDFGPGGGIPVVSPGQCAETSVALAKFGGFMN